MIDATAFLTAFGDDGVATFHRASVAALDLPGHDAKWLTETGLPRSAAPCLSFGAKDEFRLPTLEEAYQLDRYEHAGRYRLIGSNGCGDPIAIDCETGDTIVYLIHDEHFARIFINSSLTALVTCLVGYKRLVDVTRAEKGGDAFLHGKVSEGAVRDFKTLVAITDPPAIHAGTMWSDEVHALQGA